MTNEEMADKVRQWWQADSRVTIVCVWRDWLGGPREQTPFELIELLSFPDGFRLVFDCDTTLTLWRPAGLVLTPDLLIIKRADQLRHECYRDESGTREVWFYEDYAQRGEMMMRFDVYPKLGRSDELRLMSGRYDVLLRVYKTRVINSSGRIKKFWEPPWH